MPRGGWCPTMRDGLSSTNVFVHVEATRAGAGIGFLPCFTADLHPDLVRLLPDDFAERLPYWMVLRPDSMRRPAVAAVVQALREQTAAHREALLGRGGSHRLLRSRRFGGARWRTGASRYSSGQGRCRDPGRGEAEPEYFSSTGEIAQQLDDGRRRRARALQPVPAPRRRPGDPRRHPGRRVVHAGGRPAGPLVDRDPQRAGARLTGRDDRCRGAPATWRPICSPEPTWS